jgi:hypothetical protein
MTRAVSLVVMALLGAGCDLIENRQVHPLVESGQSAPGSPGNGGYQGSSEPARSGAGGYQPSKGYGGDGGYGGYGGNGGAGGGRMSALCFSPVPNELCLPSCYVDPNQAGGRIVMQVCDPTSGIWSCPNGWVAPSSCPLGTCGSPLYQYCCDFMKGGSSQPSCGPNGLRQSCVPGSAPTQSADCVPAGLAVTNCAVLRGLACSVPDQQCSTGPTSCKCDSGATNALVWMCSTSPF